MIAKPRMLKATSVNKFGCESLPASVEVNDAGYVEFPEDPDAVSYNLYAPLEGFEDHGPWYFKKAYTRREARRARFTVVGLYEEHDLSPLMSPAARGFIELPPPSTDQAHWMVYGGPPSYTPYAIVECPEVR